MPSSIGVLAAATSESSVRETWRALRATSDIPFLVRIEFFQRHHRQEHVVFLESEKTGRVVQQHVGIQHEQPAARRPIAVSSLPFLPGCGWDSTTASRAPGLGRAGRRLGCVWRARDRCQRHYRGRRALRRAAASARAPDGIDVSTVAGLVGAFGSGISGAIDSSEEISEEASIMRVTAQRQVPDPHG